MLYDFHQRTDLYLRCYYCRLWIVTVSSRLSFPAPRKDFLQKKPQAGASLCHPTSGDAFTFTTFALLLDENSSFYLFPCEYPRLKLSRIVGKLSNKCRLTWVTDFCTSQLDAQNATAPCKYYYHSSQLLSTLHYESALVLTVHHYYYYFDDDLCAFTYHILIAGK